MTLDVSLNQFTSSQVPEGILSKLPNIPPSCFINKSLLEQQFLFDAKSRILKDKNWFLRKIVSKLDWLVNELKSIIYFGCCQC
eukprot:snap_masked-scaffold_16-processed-gene-0.21-mRNA-1 protein AED:1.00 eAED:1.00 QI:0/0/0/0/1/1/4/0/82